MLVYAVILQFLFCHTPVFTIAANGACLELLVSHLQISVFFLVGVLWGWRKYPLQITEGKGRGWGGSLFQGKNVFWQMTGKFAFNHRGSMH